MIFATRKNQRPDGELLLVAKDRKRAVSCQAIAPNLQTALENWERLLPRLTELSEALNQGKASAIFDLDLNTLSAPLPRAYGFLDGSSFINHVILVRKARNAEPPETLRTDPLMYQALSDRFMGPYDPIEAVSEEHGIDLEAEVAVITDTVPMATKEADAMSHIKLVMLCNDVSLRNLVPEELAKGFGFLVSKPSSSFSPFALTPDELGKDWRDGRVHLDLQSKINGKWFGNPNAGPEMYFSFPRLIEHATQTRQLSAGTIIGSGTVSNKDESKGSSCLAEKRILEKLSLGEIRTPFLKFGDTVEIDMQQNGISIFGRIHQKVVRYNA